MKKKRTLIFLLFLLAGLFYEPIKNYAEKDSSNLINGLSYEIVYPENQKNKNLGYFDLTMKPGLEQEVSVKLYNSLPRELKVKIQLNSAKTNSIGKVEYGPNDLKKDESLAIDFTEIVNGPKQVIIPPRSSNQINFSVTVPKETFNGLIAGGIQLQPVNDVKESDQVTKDIVINEFAFLVGMLLRVGETNSIKPQLKLNKTYIAFKDGKSHLFVNLSNVNPVYMEDMDVFVQVRKANKQKVLFEYRKEKMRMAPNSMIDIPIDLADKKIISGEYTAQIDVASKNGGSWSWTDDFKVNSLEANSINTKNSENNSGGMGTLWLTILILSVTFLVGISVYKRKRHKASTNKKR